MKVQALACILNEDARCVPGDIFELRDPIAELYIKQKLVKPVEIKSLSHTKEQEPADIEMETLEPVENALSRRGKRRRHPK